MSMNQIYFFNFREKISPESETKKVIPNDALASFVILSQTET